MAVFNKTVFNPDVFLTDFEDVVVPPTETSNQVGAGGGVGGGAQGVSKKGRKKQKANVLEPNQRRILFPQEVANPKAPDPVKQPAIEQPKSTLTQKFTSSNLIEQIEAAPPAAVIAKPKEEEFFDLETLALACM